MARILASAQGETLSGSLPEVEGPGEEVVIHLLPGPETAPRVELDSDIARGIASRVVSGGSLLILCAGGPPGGGHTWLLHALQLEVVRGTAPARVEAAPTRHPAAGPEPVAFEDAVPVTGAGYALFTAGGACWALAGRRGAGRVALWGSPHLAGAEACLSWLARVP